MTSNHVPQPSAADALGQIAEQMRPLLAEGRSMNDIAATLGISRRQGFRLKRMVSA